MASVINISETTKVIKTDGPLVHIDSGSGGGVSGIAGGVLSGTFPAPTFAVDMATQAELDTHANKATGAHAATAIGFTPAGSISSTNVQAAITQVAALIPTSLPPNGAAGGVLAGTFPNPSFAAAMATQASLTAHTGAASGAHPATAISFTPASGISASTVQAAIAQVATIAGTTDPEVVRDTIGTALTGTGLVSVTANDATDVITISTTATQNSTDATLRDRSTHTGTQLSTTISDFAEAAQDVIGATIQAGTNITVTYNDVANTFTINSTASGGTSTPLSIASAGMNTVTAVSAGEIYQNAGNVNTHVDYGTGGGRDPYQVAFPGMYDDGRAEWKTWGKYLLTGPGNTKLNFSNTLSGQSPRKLFMTHRSPLKWDDPYAYGNVQSIYLAKKYGIKLCAILPPAGKEGNIGNGFNSGDAGSLLYTRSYLGAYTILSESFTASKPADIFAALEGKNEPLNDFADLSSHLRNISDFVRNNSAWTDVPVVSTSVLDYYGVLGWGDQRPIFGSRSRKFYGCAHPYIAAYPPETRFDGDRSVFANTIGQAVSPNQPVWLTEAGGHDCETCDDFSPHKGTNAATRSAYTLRHALQNVKILPRGSKTFWYELLDEFGTHDPANGEFYFGLIDTTTTPWTPKPVYWALRAFLLLHDDGTQGAPLADLQVPLQYSGALGSTESLPVFWADGSWGAWFWDNRMIYDRDAHTNITVTPYNLTVTVPPTVTTAKLGDPIANETTLTNLTISGGTVTVSCSANNPRLVKFS